MRILTAQDTALVRPASGHDLRGVYGHGFERQPLGLRAVEDYTNKYKVRVVMRVCGPGAVARPHRDHTRAPLRVLKHPTSASP